MDLSAGVIADVDVWMKGLIFEGFPVLQKLLPFAKMEVKSQVLAITLILSM